MARFYPRLGSCPDCGGTGRVYSQEQDPLDTLIGDSSETCSTCRGLGKTPEELRLQWEMLPLHLRLPDCHTEDAE